MAIVCARALVLHAFAYGDTSKILRLYTRDHGLRSVIAKGAQRARSRYGGLLEPFTEGDALVYLRAGRDLHTLSGFDLVRSRQALGRDLGAFAGASLLSELLLRFGTEEPHPELYAAAVEALDRISAAPDSTAAVTALAAVWHLVALLGYRPEVEYCVGCGRAVETAEAVRFDVEAGGVACTRCRPRGRLLAASSRRDLSGMIAKGTTPDRLADPTLQRALLRAFVGVHLSPERSLHSIDLFLDQVG